MSESTVIEFKRTISAEPGGHLVEPAPTRPIIEVAKLNIGQAVRQGDVLVMRVKELPPDAVRRDRRDLAVGVRHSHIAAAPAVTFAKRERLPQTSYREAEYIYIASESRWLLDHDEHAAIVMPAGVFRSWRQVEFPAGLAAPQIVRD